MSRGVTGKESEFAQRQSGSEEACRSVRLLLTLSTSAQTLKYIQAAARPRSPLFPRTFVQRVQVICLVRHEVRLLQATGIFQFQVSLDSSLRESLSTCFTQAANRFRTFPPDDHRTLLRSRGSDPALSISQNTQCFNHFAFILFTVWWNVLAHSASWFAMQDNEFTVISIYPLSASDFPYLTIS